MPIRLGKPPFPPGALLTADSTRVLAVFCRAMLVLYAILVLSTLAVLGVAIAVYRLVRRHMRAHHPEHLPPRMGPDKAKVLPFRKRQAGQM